MLIVKMDASGIEIALKNAAATLFADPKSVTSGKIVQLTAQLASIVNSAKDLDGIGKKNLVLSILNDAVSTAQFKSLASPEVQSALSSLLTDVLPDTIDVIVDAARGKYDLQKVEEVAIQAGCFALREIVPAIMGCCRHDAVAAVAPTAAAPAAPTAAPTVAPVAAPAAKPAVPV